MTPADWSAGQVPGHVTQLTTDSVKLSMKAGAKMGTAQQKRRASYIQRLYYGPGRDSRNSCKSWFGLSCAQ